MSFWKTLKEIIFGAPLKQQFEELLQKEEVKETIAEIKEEIIEAKEEVIEVVKKKTTRNKKKK